MFDEECEVIIEQTMQQQCTEVEQIEQEEQCNTVTEQECNIVKEYKCKQASPVDHSASSSYELQQQVLNNGPS